MAQRWSTSLPRRGSRVRFPSRALKKETDWWNTNRSLFFRALTGLEGSMSPLRSGRRRPTSPGRCATSRAQYCISGFVSRLPARSALIAPVTRKYELEGSMSPLRSGRRRPTSPGRCATSRARYYISGFVSRLSARSALSFKILFCNLV